MTTVDDAIEAGARALDSNYNPDRHPVMAAMFEDYSLTAARAMWPILSAPLRGLHVMKVDYRPRLHDPSGAPLRDVCQHCQRAYPCATVRELDQIDKELGL